MISVCIIMKNSEEYIEECLKRLSAYNCEIVVADTGSTDKSIEKAKKYTDKIYSYDWNDDFSAARNFSVSKASNDVILVLDSDEYVENADFEEIEKTISSNTNLLGLITVRSFFSTNGLKQVSKAYLSRVFSKSKYHYKGKIHEQPVRKDGMASKGVILPFDAIHLGYDVSEDTLKKKAERNINLLKEELKGNNKDPYILYQLGKSYYITKDYKNAAYYFEKCHITAPDTNIEYVKTMYITYIYSLINLNENEKALKLLYLYDILSSSADFVFAVGLLYINLGRLSDAIKEFQKALTIDNADIEGVNSFASNYNIGVIYECIADSKTALEYYKKCGNYEPALKGIERIKKQSL